MARDFPESRHGEKPEAPARPSRGIFDWDRKYRDQGSIWGNEPGELARIALQYLDDNLPPAVPLTVLDLGCGYGRDSFLYARRPDFQVLGIDRSETAIARAREGARAAGLSRVEFRCGDLQDVRGGPFTIVHLSNVYQVLPPDERRAVREVIREAMEPGGLLFLSTLSVRDPQQYGKGTAVEGEDHSFIEPARRTYIHFCTGEELARDFEAFDVIALREHEYTEPRVGGDHHHISWILIAQKPVR